MGRHLFRRHLVTCAFFEARQTQAVALACQASTHLGTKSGAHTPILLSVSTTCSSQGRTLPVATGALSALPPTRRLAQERTAGGPGRPRAAFA